MSEELKQPYEQYQIDKLDFVKREDGDYSSTEYMFRGQLGTYRLRIGHNVMDGSKVLYIFKNNKHWLDLYPTKFKKILVGKDEERNELYIFRFNGKHLYIFKRQYDF